MRDQLPQLPIRGPQHGPRSVCGLAFGLLGLASGAVAQPPPEPEVPSSPPRIVFSEEVAVEWVTVPVTLVESHSPTRQAAAEAPEPAELSLADFELRIDGRLVTVESFDFGAAPFGLLFAQDLSGSMDHGDKLRLSRNVLALLLARSGELDEVAILTFAGPRVDLQVPFTSDFRVLDDATARWRAYGTTALFDALARVSEIAKESHRSRRAVVLVTDGIDNASTIAADEARSLLQGAGLPLFVLDVAARFDRPSPAVAEPVALATDPVAFSLTELASATGGRYIEVFDHGAVQGATDQVLQNLRQQYLLGFTTDGSTASWHRIDVVLRAEEGEAPRALRFRTRYFGSAPASWSSGAALTTSAAAPASTSRRTRRPNRS